MATLKQFGVGSEVFDFTQSHIDQQAWSTNFGNLLRTSQVLPGISGGYDRFGSERGFHQVGTLQTQFNMEALDRYDMQAKRDAIAAIQHWGLRPLFMQPYWEAPDVEPNERFVHARVTSINMPEQPHLHTDLFQPVQIAFETPDPIWNESVQEWGVWGETFYWGISTFEGSEEDAYPISGTTTNDGLTLGGTAYSLPRITVACGPAETAQNISIRRIVNAAVIDRVTWTGTLGNDDTLVIDCRNKRVLLNGVDDYGTHFDFLHPRWFELQPGVTNPLHSLMANGGDAATVTFEYYTRYYGA